MSSNAQNNVSNNEKTFVGSLAEAHAVNPTISANTSRRKKTTKRIKQS
jgi:hypothetical protein